MKELLDKLKNAGMILLLCYFIYLYIVMHFDKNNWWKYWLITISLILLTVISRELEKRKFNDTFQEVTY